MTKKKELVEQLILQILEDAIKEEKGSAARYQDGARLATDPRLKEMFEKLASDEVEHEKALKQKYYEIKKQLGLKVLNEGEAGSDVPPE